MYSGAGYQVVQQVLESITGKMLYQLMNDYIFTPLKMRNSTGKLLYPNKHKYKLADMDNLYRMYPETAAAGVWMSPNDLHKLTQDLIKIYNDNNGIILQQSTLKMITKGEHPQWDKKYENYGLGMFVSTLNRKKLFAHEGWNYGYRMHFHCVPERNEYEIIMINYAPNIKQKNIIQNARKTLKL